MKRFLQIIAILFLSFNLQAQNSQKAKTLLDEVSAKVKSYSNISIDFKYATTNTKENLNQESKGTVVMQGNKYVLNFMGVTKIFDGKKSGRSPAEMNFFDHRFFVHFIAIQFPLL